MNAPVPPGAIRLTAFAHGGGRGCRIAPGHTLELARGARLTARIGEVAAGEPDLDVRP